jgi:hypothetical protein
MNLTSLPTDNLYKFLALAGLAIIFFSLSVPVSQLLRIRSRLFEFDIQSAKLKAEIEVVTGLITALEKKPNPTQADVDLLREKNNELLIRSVVSKAEIEVVRRQTNDVLRLRAAIAAGVLIGLTAATVGFSLWYTRLQAYQDALARKQVSALANESLKLTKARRPPTRRINHVCAFAA